VCTFSDQHFDDTKATCEECNVAQKWGILVGVVLALAAFAAALWLLVFKLRPRVGSVPLNERVQTLHRSAAHLHLVPIFKQLLGFYQVRAFRSAAPFTFTGRPC